MEDNLPDCVAGKIQEASALKWPMSCPQQGIWELEKRRIG